MLNAPSPSVLTAYLALPVVKQAIVEGEDGALWKIEVRKCPASGLTLRRTVRLG